jgi:hypothetical protein
MPHERIRSHADDFSLSFFLDSNVYDATMLMLTMPMLITMMLCPEYTILRRI